FHRWCPFKTESLSGRTSSLHLGKRRSWTDATRRTVRRLPEHGRSDSILTAWLARRRQYEAQRPQRQLVKDSIGRFETAPRRSTIPPGLRTRRTSPSRWRRL